MTAIIIYSIIGISLLGFWTYLIFTDDKNKEKMRNNQSKIVLGLLVGGVLCLILGLYSLFNQSESQAKSSVTILAEQYERAVWNEVGPAREIHPRPHLWMRKHGQISYQLIVESEFINKQAVLSAVLSAERDNRYMEGLNQTSDVTLFWNDTKISTRNTGPDDWRGRTITWIIPANKVQEINHIQFQIEEGQNANGLTIYGPIQLSFR